MSENKYPGAQAWPRADLDPIRRLQVLAAVTPFPVTYRELVIPAPFETVWSVVADLERELPRSLSSVRTARFVRRGGEGGDEDGAGLGDGQGTEPEETRELFATGWLGQRARFDVVLRPGWCVMRSRFVLGAMAAVEIPEGAPQAGGTRFASLGGFRLPGARLARPALELLGRRAMRRFGDHPEFAAKTTPERDRGEEGQRGRGGRCAARQNFYRA
jgi:hypothetical protein